MSNAKKIKNDRRKDYPWRCKIVGLSSWIYLSERPRAGVSFDLACLVPANDDASARLKFHTPSAKGGFGTIRLVETNPHHYPRKK
jgi:hypothetical protein